MKTFAAFIMVVVGICFFAVLALATEPIRYLARHTSPLVAALVTVLAVAISGRIFFTFD